MNDPVYREYVRISMATFFVSLITVVACSATAFWNWKQHFERKVLGAQLSGLQVRIEKVEREIQLGMQQCKQPPLQKR